MCTTCLPLTAPDFYVQVVSAHLNPFITNQNKAHIFVQQIPGEISFCEKMHQLFKSCTWLRDFSEKELYTCYVDHAMSQMHKHHAIKLRRGNARLSQCKRDTEALSLKASRNHYVAVAKALNDIQNVDFSSTPPFLFTITELEKQSHTTLINTYKEEAILTLNWLLHKHIGNLQFDCKQPSDVPCETRIIDDLRGQIKEHFPLVSEDTFVTDDFMRNQIKEFFPLVSESAVITDDFMRSQIKEFFPLVSESAVITDDFMRSQIKEFFPLVSESAVITDDFKCKVQRQCQLLSVLTKVKLSLKPRIDHLYKSYESNDAKTTSSEKSNTQNDNSNLLFEKPCRDTLKNEAAFSSIDPSCSSEEKAELIDVLTNYVSDELVELKKALGIYQLQKSIPTCDMSPSGSPTASRSPRAGFKLHSESVPCASPKPFNKTPLGKLLHQIRLSSCDQPLFSQNKTRIVRLLAQQNTKGPSFENDLDPDAKPLLESDSEDESMSTEKPLDNDDLKPAAKSMVKSDPEDESMSTEKPLDNGDGEPGTGLVLRRDSGEGKRMSTMPMGPDAFERPLETTPKPPIAPPSNRPFSRLPARGLANTNQSASISNGPSASASKDSFHFSVTGGSYPPDLSSCAEANSSTKFDEKTSQVEPKAPA